MATATLAPDRPALAPGRLRLITVVLAAACGLTVANLYYAQPLLALIATSMHVSQGTATIVVTATQVGYALALMFVLPLGDLIENRKLTSRLLIGTTAALLLAAFSPAFGVFLAASVLIGVTSVVAQILVPLAAHFAPPAESGRVVGRVMSGLLLGILLARTVASLVAAAWGWRTIYVISAALMLGLAVVLRKSLPVRRPDSTASYPRLLASVVELARTEPVLRRRAICQATMFGAFSAYWTVITFELIDQHHLSQVQVGLFALVGAAGAAAAPLGGWLADHGYGRNGSGAALLLGSAALVIASLGHSSLILLGLGAVLLDLAVQCHGVMSQQEIYGLRSTARARINTVFMGSTFIGGAIGSACAGALHAAYGWTAASLFAAALPLIGFAVWLTGLRRTR